MSELVVYHIVLKHVANEWSRRAIYLYLFMLEEAESDRAEQREHEKMLSECHARRACKLMAGSEKALYIHGSSHNRIWKKYINKRVPFR